MPSVPNRKSGIRVYGPKKPKTKKPKPSYHAPRGRFRTRGAVAVLSPSIQTDLAGNFSSSNPTMAYGELESTSDLVVPAYRKRVAAGEVFFNNYTHRQEFFRDGGGNGYMMYEVANPSNGFKMQDDTAHSAWMALFLQGEMSPSRTVPSVPVIQGDELSRLLTEISTSVLSKRCRSDNNLWEDLAEFDKTLDMIHKPLGAFSRFNEKFNLRGFGSVANAWLQYQYGIKPLISSINGIVKGLKKPRGKIRQSSRASEDIQSTSHTVSSPSLIPSYGDGRMCDMHVNTQHDITARALSLDELEVSTGFNVGFSTKGLLTLPWELVRYSFVIDWFVNVGDFLGAYAPALGCNQLGGCVTIREQIQTIYTMDNFRFVPGYWNGWFIAQGTAGTYKSESRIVRRIPLGNAGLVVNNDFKLDSIARALSGISLAIQQVSHIWGGGSLPRNFRR